MTGLQWAWDTFAEDPGRSGLPASYRARSGPENAAQISWGFPGDPQGRVAMFSSSIARIASQTVDNHLSISQVAPAQGSLGGLPKTPLDSTSVPD